MAMNRRDIITALEILIAVLSTLLEVLERQQASEDRLLERKEAE